MMQRYLTAKITNADELNKRLGRTEAGNVVRHALRRIARDARMSGGEIAKMTATRVVAGFVTQLQAEQMALLIDHAINEVPVPQGLRIQSAVFVADRDQASVWQQSQYEMFRGVERAPQAIQMTRALVSYGNQVLEVSKAHPDLTIGRLAVNGLMVDHSWVSRHHATLTWDEGRVSVADYSSNSTYVRYADDGREVRIWRDKWLVERDASLAFGMSLAVSNGQPVQVQLKFE